MYPFHTMQSLREVGSTGGMRPYSTRAAFSDGFDAMTGIGSGTCCSTQTMPLVARPHAGL
jgi:hypothetical protein